MNIKNVGMIGRGAVGSLFGNCIHQVLGKEHFHFIVGEDRYTSYQQNDFYINDVKSDFSYVSNKEECNPLDLLIIAVKGPVLLESLEIVKPFVSEDTIIITLLNGIVSEQIVEEVLGKGIVIHSIAQMMDAVKKGNQVTYKKLGEIVLGCVKEERKDVLYRVKQFLDSVQIPNYIAKNILQEQWLKLMFNCGINQVCAVYDVPYQACQKQGELQPLFVDVMKEVLMIAKCEGIALQENDVNKWVEKLEKLDPNSMPSMRQDRLAKRISEVDFFAKTMIDLAKVHHVEVPLNAQLYKQIKEIEKLYSYGR